MFNHLVNYYPKNNPCKLKIQIITTPVVLHRPSVCPASRPLRPLPSVFRESVVRVTIEPAFAWLGRRDHGMSTRACVLRRMSVRRIITTQRRAALLTCAQMNPGRTDLCTFSALAPNWLFDRSDLRNVNAGGVRHGSHGFQKLVHELDRHGAFANRGGDAFDRAGSYVPRREHTRPARLQKKRLTF